jgi:hypothetical protein
MANVVYNYPKSSCSCYNCTETSYPCSTTGLPSNMSVRNCQTPAMFECYDRKPFRFDIEPRNEQGYKNLNPVVMKGKFSDDFQRIECPGIRGCPKIQYASTDPRLVSAAHSGQVLTLDRPPMNSTPDLTQISTDKNLDGYGQGYRTYSDIDGGQIMYYIDKSTQDPFYSPNFSTSARALGTLYRDPMGAMKPQYDREPLKCNDPLNTTKDHYDGGLSWIQDSQEHRQDLLSLQMRKRNQERFEPRWEATVESKSGIMSN